MKRSVSSVDLAVELVRAALIWRRPVNVEIRTSGRNTTYDVHVDVEPNDRRSEDSA